jgi:hypothetical protein
MSNAGHAGREWRFYLDDIMRGAFEKVNTLLDALRISSWEE